MRKIPTIFVRDWDGNPKHVTRGPNPECAWVFDGEGVATRKFDGTCVMYDGTRWWARREVKADKFPPPNFVELSRDDETGKVMGWEPIEQSSFAKFHAEAVQATGPAEGITGTFELIGPKINGNPENAPCHILVEHAEAVHVEVSDLTFDGIRDAVIALAETSGAEGIVWHGPDGRMAKVKARDFPAPEETNA